MTSLSISQHPAPASPLPAACTLGQADAERQLVRARALAPHLTGVARSATQLTLTFSAAADAELLAAFAATERACCSFFERITERATPEGSELDYLGAADGSHSDVLAELARMFDAASVGEGVGAHGASAVEAAGANGKRAVDAGSNGGRRRSVALLAAAGLACSACLIPGLALGGAGALGALAIDPDRLIAALAAVGLLAYAGYALVARRRRLREAPAPGCGC